MSALEDEPKMNSNSNSENDDSDIENPRSKLDDLPAETINIESKGSDSDQKMREHLVLAHGPGCCGTRDCPPGN